MGTRSEALAKQVEAKVQEAVAEIEQLSDTNWRQVTETEHWTVGVTAHHLASALEPVASMVTAIASGQSRGHFTKAMLDEMNARHAQEHANCTKPETIALLKRGSRHRDGPRPDRRSAGEERDRVHGRPANDRRAAHHWRPDHPLRGAPRQHSEDGRPLTRAPSGV